MNQKTCGKCKRRLRVDRFYPQPDTLDRLQSWCKLCKVEYTRNWKRRNAPSTKIARRAAKAVECAVKRGDLKPVRDVPCSGCGNTAEHYHHESYRKDKWLVVVPLCAPCHRLYHKTRNAVVAAIQG